MTDYIETQAKDGTMIRIEVESTTKAGAGFTRPSAAAAVTGEASRDAYQQVLATIQACANGMIETLQNLDAAPSAASINFAIKIDAEAGAMVAKSGNEAQFKVALSWKQVEPEAENKSDKSE